MRCRLAPRESSPRWLLLATPVAAIAATLACGLLAGGAVGISQAAAIDAFFLAPVRDWYGLSELLVKAAPLALIASGFGSSSGLWSSLEFSIVYFSTGATGGFSIKTTPNKEIFRHMLDDFNRRRAREPQNF